MQCNKGDGINVYERKNQATLSETTSNTVCADDSNSTNGSPSGLFDKKREEYVYYFNLELTQAFCNCIVLVALDKQSVENVQKSRELEKLKNFWG